jgi:hypothetical protein
VILLKGDDAANWFQKAMDVPYEVRLMRMGNTLKRKIKPKYQILEQNSLVSYVETAAKRRQYIQ